MHVGMFVEAAFNLHRPDPLPGDFDQIVGATQKVIITIPLDETVSGCHPVSTHRLARLLGAVPIARRGRMTADEHCALLARFYRLTIWRDEPDFVARNARAGGTDTVIVELVGKIDV